MVTPHRVTLVEARTEPGLLEKIAQRADVTHLEAAGLFARVAERLRHLLGARTNPFEISMSGSVRVDQLAGLIRLTPTIELQVVPKFLDVKDDSWQDDFFLLALFSQSGRVLPRDRVRAGISTRSDLATLVGQTLVRMVNENQRRPIRTYSMREVQDFSLDGDVDPMEFAVLDPEGLRQTVLNLRRDNPFNAALSAAMTTLLQEVRDSETRKQLTRAIHNLGRQSALPAKLPQFLPARYREWQSPYDLARQVLEGFGVGYSPQHLHAPGFVLRTWSTWQSLVVAALRTGLPNATVAATPPYTLGKRALADMDVTPDAVVSIDGAPRLVVDAKYRTREDRAATIAASDVYESMAFMEATDTTRTVLIYPRPASEGPAMEVGSTRLFETVTIGSRIIEGFTAEVRGISGIDGFARFSSQLASTVSEGLTSKPRQANQAR